MLIDHPNFHDLRNSEATLRAIVDNTAACVFAKDLGGRYILANRSFIELFGWPDADYVLGKTDYELHSREAADAYVQNDRLVLDAGTPLEFEETAPLPTGVRTYLMLKFPLRDQHGAIYGVCGIATDITERTRAEQERLELLERERIARAEAEAAQQQYRDLVNGLDAIVWEADAQTWQFTFVSDRAESLLGYPVRAWRETPGFWARIIHPDDRNFAINFCMTACAACQDHDFEYRAVAADGRIVWLRDIVYVVRGEDGKAAHLRGIMIDITRTKELEEALKRQADALRDADRRKDEFLATLAHELRNPLAPLRNSVQVLRSPGADANKAQRIMDTMARQVDHLVRLVDDLIDVSRVMRGRIELRRESIEVAAIVQRAVETVQPIIEAQGHALHLALPPQSLILHADPMRLSQVIANLLTNAAKYTPPGGEIRVTATREGGDAVISVRDNGLGIPAEMQSRIFDLFVQVDHATDVAQSGLGVGLTVVKSLVEMHQGSVKVHSAGPNQGAEFTLRLPLHIPHQSPAPSQQAEPPTASSPPPCRLLVVDDNRDAADTLAMLLESQGHQVQVAYDGAGALHKAASNPPDVVFLDLGMPVMDGYAVAQQMRTTPGLEGTILVALTGWGQARDRQRTAEAGFHHHLVKPPEPGEVERLLETCVREKTIASRAAQ